MTPKIIESQTIPGAAITGDCENIAFLDTKAVAKYLGCSLPTARQIMYRSDFPLIKVGKNLRVERSALKEWAQTRHI